ncbi:MAG: hypothetical protein GWQ05_16680 [Verrucomicrobiaceae bacterium]|jgi:hypothetical protein|nr:hypothetical protein [Verrucomicrobiales bacterium]MDA7644319.1 hypothetical protein [Verrucomicrobiales bacterium]MDF1784663.1 hypothetical protein [Verrucomicrobiales bacterium]NCF92566.1 hypothetical protein [Verrucomicrobiaceae bacterium]
MKVQQGVYTYTLELDAPLIKAGKHSFALIDALPKNLSKDGLENLKKLVDQKAEGVWVQSRLMVVLGLTGPEESDTTASVVEVPLRAMTDSDDEEEGITFSCVSGKDGRTRLNFSDKTKPEEAKRISNAFWKILLAEPLELDDFSAETVDQSGAKVAYGVRDGRCFFGDPDDVDIDIPAEVGGKDVGRGLADFDPAGMVADDEDEWMRGDSESEWDEDEDKENEDYGFMRPDDAVDDDY